MEKLSAQLDGRMNIMTKHIRNNTTPKAYSMSGIKLNFDKISLIASDI